MRSKHTIWSPKNYVIVHLTFATERTLIVGTIVSKNGELQKEPFEFETIELLVAHFGKTAAYLLHVDGMGVLTRIVDAHSDFKRDLIINGDSDDFYFTSLTNEQTKLVSFVRKSVAQHSVDYFIEHKLYLLSVSCGFTPIGILLDETESIKVDYYLERKNNEFVSLERTGVPDRRIDFQGTYHSKQELICKAIVLGATSKGNYETFEFVTILNEYKEFTKFRKVGVTSVAAILLLLILNYFYVNHLNNEIANKEQEISLSNSNLSILDKLSQEELRKQQLVINSGVVTTNFISYYLEEIGKSVPKDIRLSEMYVFPVKEKLKEKRKVEFDQSKIEIIGWTKSTTILDDWIELIDKQDWVKSVELMNYQKLATDESSFKLIIYLAQ